MLGLFNRLTGRPGSDAITDPTKYLWLTEANNELIGAIASVCPNVLYSAPALLSTTDSKVFTFGTDGNGYAKTPMGKTGIYPDLASVPDSPWREGLDYMAEGSQIRIPNDGSYSGPLYWRGVSQPADIDATHNPLLLPEASRALIAHIATLNFARAFARNPNLAQLELDYLGEPWGNNKGQFAQWCLVWRKAFRAGGAIAITGRQLAISSQMEA